MMRPAARPPYRGFPGATAMVRAVRALPTADRYLSEFFADRRRGAVEPGRVQIDRTDADLRLTIELAADRLLTEAEAVLVAAERQFEPVAPVGRVLPATSLPAVLEAYLEDGGNRPASMDENRARLDTCQALVRRLAGDPDLIESTRRLRRLDESIRLELATMRPPRGRLLRRRVRG